MDWSSLKGDKICDQKFIQYNEKDAKNNSIVWEKLGKQSVILLVTDASREKLQ